MSDSSPLQRYLKITFLRSDGLTQYFTLGQGESVLVGRDLTCDCRLEGRKISRRHCRITYRADGRIHVQDNASHNGTFVNGIRILESNVDDGARLTIGEWEGHIEFITGTVRRTRTVPGLMPALAFPAVKHGQEEKPSTTSGTSPSAASAVAQPPAPFEGPTDPSFRADAKTAQELGEGDTRIIDMRKMWKWEEKPASTTDDQLRAAPVEDNPIVKRLTESHGRLDFRGLSKLDADETQRIPTPGTGYNVDAVALRLVFQVTESLHAAPSMDAFLADMSESLYQAARAKAVVVLLPDPATGELVPRVVKNRRAEESVQLSRTIIEHALTKRMAIATEDAAADARFASGESVLRFDLKAVLVVPLMRERNVIGAVYLTRDIPFSNTERDLVAALAHMIAMGLERSRLREQIAHEERQRRALERFHAPDVVRRLMMEENPRGDGLFLESLIATVLFCDLSGFTRVCEQREPEAVGRLLNTYLGSMTEIVFQHGGTVDKYIGDAIMCIFGAPFMSPDDALRAVRCAIEMRRAFRRMMERGDFGDVPDDLDVHIGVNTGKVVAGTVGSSLRMEYTALGDTVNLAARLEGIAKKGQIVIGATTAELVQKEIPVRSLGMVSVKGKRQAVEVFEVVDEELDEYDEMTEAATNVLVTS